MHRSLRRATPALLLLSFLCRTGRGQSSNDPIAQWLLPHTLDEISGLALTPDGRLLAHEDELGRIFEVDYRRGVIVKQFAIGPGVLRADFEAITTVGDSVYLLSSNGRLYGFLEGGNGQRVSYTLHDTGLGAACEFEGLTYDAVINSLLLACKTVLTEHLRHMLVIYRWSLAQTGPRLSRLTVPIKSVVGSTGWTALHPSDITIDPCNGNYLLIASREQALVEITREGTLVFAHPLPGVHPQPEGVAITRDSILLVSDERSRGPATDHPHRSLPDARALLTLYRWPCGQ